MLSPHAEQKPVNFRNNTNWSQLVKRPTLLSEPRVVISFFLSIYLSIYLTYFLTFLLSFLVWSRPSFRHCIHDHFLPLIENVHLIILMRCQATVCCSWFCKQIFNYKGMECKAGFIPDNSIFTQIALKPYRINRLHYDMWVYSVL